MITYYLSIRRHTALKMKKKMCKRQIRERVSSFGSSVDGNMGFRQVEQGFSSFFANFFDIVFFSKIFQIPTHRLLGRQ